MMFILILRHTNICRYCYMTHIYDVICDIATMNSLVASFTLISDAQYGNIHNFT